MTERDTDAGKAPVADDGGGAVYSYRPGLVGGAWELRLRPDGMAWQVGAASGVVRYQSVRRVRLSYRPATQQQHRFLTEIWSSGAPKLQILSTSWRGITDQARQDAGYRAFVMELHRRLGAAGSRAEFLAGTPPIIYGLGLVVFAGATLAFAGITVRALQYRQWSAAAIVAGLFVLLGWQLGSYFWRNRPQAYHPDAIPEQVLPRG